MKKLIYIILLIFIGATFNVSAEPAAPTEQIPGVKYIIGPLDYDSVYDFHEGLAAFKEKDSEKYGYIDTSGKEAIKPQYCFADNFSEGLAAVRDLNSGKMGYIDKQGNMVIQPQFNWAWDFQEGVSAVDVDNNNWGLIDKSGKLITEPKYTLISSFIEGMAFVGTAPQGSRHPTKFGFINSKGEEVTKIQYDFAYPFYNGLAIVEKADKNGNYKEIYINKKGEELKKLVSNSALAFYQSLSRLCNADKVYENINYKVIDNDYKYDTILNFNKGLAIVGKNSKYGYVDKTSKEVIPLVFDNVGEFNEGLACVSLGEKKYFISSPLDLPDSWAKDSVNTAIDKQIVPLYMQYGYKQNITRKDFVTLVVNLIKTKTGNLDAFLTEKNIDVSINPFNDTKDTNAIIAYKLGIAGGVGYGNFNPDGEITRQEAAVMLASTAKILGTDISTANSGFSDKGDIKDWAKASVDFVSSKSVMTGIAGNKFDPAGKCIKEQAFSIVIRLLKIL